MAVELGRETDTETGPDVVLGVPFCPRCGTLIDLPDCDPINCDNCSYRTTYSGERPAIPRPSAIVSRLQLSVLTPHLCLSDSPISLVIVCTHLFRSPGVPHFALCDYHKIQATTTVSGLGTASHIEDAAFGNICG